MRVLLVLGDSGACAYYRMELPAAMAKVAQLPVEVSTGLPGKETKKGTVLDPEKVRKHYDVVVIQRPLLRQIIQAIPQLKKVGVTVVVEVDDDFTSIHKDNQAYWRTHPANKQTKFNRDHVRTACALADHVTVTTPALVPVYGGHGRVTVIPNCIPGFLLNWKYRKLEHVCGWAGAVGTHPHDLQQVGTGVAKALEMTGAKFLVIGESEGVRERLGLQEEVPQTGWLPIADYYKWLGRLSAGIVPLEESSFNRAKSNLKGLEYAATGVPFVASPLPEYRRLSLQGAGILAPRARDWEKSLIRLLTDAHYRQEVIHDGRAAIRKNYVLEHNWHLWLETWEKAWKRKRNA